MMNDSLSVAEKCYTNNGNPAVLKSVPRTARLILDLGCGAGDNARILKQGGATIDGVTLSEKEKVQAEKWCRQVYLHNLETGLPAHTDYYDAVIASHVLEHICYPAQLLEDVKNRLVPGGTLIVAIPNLLNWKYRCRMLLGRFEYNRDGGIMDSTHFRWYTLATARRLLEEHGYTVELAFADGYLPMPILRRVMPIALGRLIDRSISVAFPGLFGIQLILVARARTD
jgi:SAM-dependent methyltransferase